jgi:hypothetical protein
MAKLTDRTELTTPADGDLYVTTDVSDTTDAATGTDKKITWSSIKTALKTYFDTLYATALGADDNYVTDAEKAALHAAVTVADSAEIDLTLTGQQISASIIAGSIDETKLDTSVNASLDLADTSLQDADATTTPTASKLVQRDASANIYVNNYFANTTSTVSAAGTTVLTVASARTQNLTGSSNQTFQLPDATTLSLSSIFEFNNNSSGSLTITNAGAVSQYVVPAGGAVLCFCTSIGSANGTWDFHAQAPASATWSSGATGLVMNSVLTTSPSVGSGASSSTAPSFIPQRGAPTTGFGGDGTNLHATIAGTSAMTIAAAKTTVPGLLVSGLTASELTATDASKNIVSLPVATYPSLTETSYVKGVTSAIQTQLNAKLTSSSISDTAYGVGWNGDTTVAPSKNAVYDEIELRATKASPTLTGTTTVDRLDYDRAVGLVNAIGNLGATETIDWSTHTHYTGTLDSNITFTYSNQVSGQSITLYLSYDATAQRTITWPTTTWLDNATGAAPTTPSASGKVLVVTLVYIGTTTYGSATGNYTVYA